MNNYIIKKQISHLARYIPNNTIKNIKILKKYNFNQHLVLSQIFKDKSGVYLFTNNIDNKIYVGSSIGLTKIFNKYFNVNALTKNRMFISLSLLEYKKKKNFALYNEYCSREEVIKKEQHYIIKLNLGLILLKVVDSSLSYTSITSLLKLR